MWRLWLFAYICKALTLFYFLFIKSYTAYRYANDMKYDNIVITRSSTALEWMLQTLALMKTVLFLWPLYKHVLPIPMYIHWYKFENNELERLWSCKRTVLFYILEYSYIVQIAKRRTCPVFAFNMQIPDQVESLIVFCMLKANTCLNRLFAICTRWGELVILTSPSTIFQSYMWRHIYVQADWRRSWTYGRAPNAINVS